MNPQKLVLPVVFLSILGVVLLSVWGVRELFSSTTATTTVSRSSSGSLFPFGSGDVAPSTKPAGAAGATNDDTLLPDVRQVTDRPVAGATFASTTRGTVVRYVERDTGHIYEARVDVPGVTRLTKTTLTKVQQALWVNGSSSIMQYASENGGVENFLATIQTQTPNEDISGEFIRKYEFISASKDGSALLGALTTNNGATLELMRGDGTGARTILTTPLPRLIPHLAGSVPYVTDTPSSGVPGNLFRVADGVLTKVLGGLPGLMALPTARGQYFIISTGGPSVIETALFDPAARTTQRLPFQTLTTKCAWAVRTEPLYVCAAPSDIPPGTYPDDWLLGKVSTTDTMWVGNARTGSTTVAIELPQYGAFDAAQVAVDEKGEYALFINRIDNTLWLTRLRPLQ